MQDVAKVDNVDKDNEHGHHGLDSIEDIVGVEYSPSVESEPAIGEGAEESRAWQRERAVEVWRGVERCCEVGPRRSCVGGVQGEGST